MGTIAELWSDDKGLVWPENIAPFKVYLARIGAEKNVVAEADALYIKLTDAGISVLYDDRDSRPGEKFADADLMGIPYRVVISEKTVKAKYIELKQRTSSESSTINSADNLIKKLS